MFKDEIGFLLFSIISLSGGNIEEILSGKTLQNVFIQEGVQLINSLIFFSYEIDFVEIKYRKYYWTRQSF